MSKSTGAVIMPSAAKLGPWGDPGWRFSGAMQLVEKGPDFLYAQWPLLDGAEHHGVAQYASMVLRDEAPDRAADIAVMAFALLQVEEWDDLHPWWGDVDDRAGQQAILETIAARHAGSFKLAVVEMHGGAVGADVLDHLRELGFETTVFTPPPADTPASPR